MDHLTAEKRSWNMGRIRSENTKPEILFRRAIHKKGYRYRVYAKNLPGKPDIVLKKYKTVIFINGCFWHKHENCQRGNKPKSRNEYWDEKLEKNVLRDKKNYAELKEQGWNVLVIWECEIKDISKAVLKFEIFLEELEN